MTITRRVAILWASALVLLAGSGVALVLSLADHRVTAASPCRTPSQSAPCFDRSGNWVSADGSTHAQSSTATSANRYTPTPSYTPTYSPYSPSYATTTSLAKSPTWGDTITTTGGLTFTVGAPKSIKKLSSESELKGGLTSRYGAGYRLIGFDYTVANKSANSMNPYKVMPGVTVTDGSSATGVPLTGDGYEFPMADLLPGKTWNLTVVYALPKQRTEIQMAVVAHGDSSTIFVGQA